MRTTDEQMLDAAAAAAASKATYSGATAAVAGWLLSSEFGVLVGLAVGITGLLVNWFYRAKQDRREEKEHRRRMKDMETKPDETA